VTGPIVVKAAVLTTVEKLQEAGISKLYTGHIWDWQQVVITSYACFGTLK
jgi:hypothetical protein